MFGRMAKGSIFFRNVSSETAREVALKAESEHDVRRQNIWARKGKTVNFHDSRFSQSFLDHVVRQSFGLLNWHHITTCFLPCGKKSRKFWNFSKQFSRDLSRRSVVNICELHKNIWSGSEEEHVWVISLYEYFIAEIFSSGMENTNMSIWKRMLEERKK